MDAIYKTYCKEIFLNFYNYCLTSKEESINEIREIKFSKESFPLLSKVQDLLCLIPAKLLSRATNSKNSIEANRFNQLLHEVKNYEAKLAKDVFEKYWLELILSHLYVYIIPNPDEADSLLIRQEGNLKNLSKEDTDSLSFHSADYKIKKHISKKLTTNEIYQYEYEGVRDFRMRERSFLMILKGFSSSTPFFYAAMKNKFNHRAIRGGGLYLKWKKIGIIIDPGINYVENLHNNQLSIKDINTIIVTHNHIDHNGDLSEIDDLIYQLYGKDSNHISVYWDQSTATDMRGKIQKNLSSCYRLLPDKEIVLGDNDIVFETIKTHHIFSPQNNKYEEDTFALKFKLLENGVIKKTIGYTSDSKYFDELGVFFKDCDIIIVNISETEDKDYACTEAKKNHLGFMGCRDLISSCKNNEVSPIFIVSEFWAGKGGDIRMELVHQLREKTGIDKIYPGDIGNLFFLDRPTFLCNNCRTEEALDSLRVVKMGIDFSPIFLICKHCSM